MSLHLAQPGTDKSGLMESILELAVVPVFFLCTYCKDRIVAILLEVSMLAFLHVPQPLRDWHDHALSYRLMQAHRPIRSSESS